MEIGKQIEAAQTRADQLAIQESNLRDQMAPLQVQLAPLQAQLDHVLRAKHQAVGAVAALMKLANEQLPPAPTVEPPIPTGRLRKSVRG